MNYQKASIKNKVQLLTSMNPVNQFASIMKLLGEYEQWKKNNNIQDIFQTLDTRYNEMKVKMDMIELDVKEIKAMLQKWDTPEQKDEIKSEEFIVNAAPETQKKLIKYEQTSLINSVAIDDKTDSSSEQPILLDTKQDD